MGDRCFTRVDHGEQGPGGQKRETCEELLVFGREKATAEGFPCAEQVHGLFQHVVLPGVSFRLLVQPGETLLGHLVVCEDERVHDEPQVAQRGRVFQRVQDGVVAKGPDDNRDRVGVAHVGKAGSRYGAVLSVLQGEVAESHRGVRELARAVQRGEPVQPVVGDLDLGEMCLLPARGRIAGGVVLARQGVEDRRSPCPGKTDDCCFHCCRSIEKNTTGGNLKMKHRPAAQPRYFCANCGCEVAPGTARCPRCLKAFTAVRCPRCGFEGREDDFRAGCPACGHLQPTLADPAAGRGRRAARRGRQPAATPPRRAHASKLLLSRRFYVGAGVILAAAAIALIAYLLVSP